MIMKSFIQSLSPHRVLITFISIFVLSACEKEVSTYHQGGEDGHSLAAKNANAETPPFNLEVILRGEGNRFGHVKFRQDNDVDKIINLDTWVRDLDPNHAYLLQRAVDAIDVVDGNCTSTSWLTLGRGLMPHSILTDENGNGSEALWRSVAALPAGSAFDIHFRVVDAVSMEVVLTSDCYKYIVR
jgi:hypothetical protein